MPLATKEQVFEKLWNYGFFSGFEVIVNKFHPDAGEAARFKKHLYELLLKEVLEAKKEAVRLLAVIEQMEAKCRHGMTAGGSPFVGWDANASSLQGDIQAFDGWTVSLFESNITLLHYILNIETAGNRSVSLHKSILGVVEKRRANRKLFESDPAFFKLKLM